MPTYSDSLIKLIDERIRLLVGGGEGGDPDQGRQLPVAAPGVMGTVVDRDLGALAFGLSDTFTRTVVDGWGDTDTGQVWVISGGAPSLYSTTGSRAQVLLDAVSLGRNQFVAGLAVPDVDIKMLVFSPPTAVGGNINHGLVARWSDGSNFYYLQAAYKATGLVDLALIKRVANVDTTLVTATDILGYTPTFSHFLRFQVVGNTLRGKMWAGSEPDDWKVTATAADLPVGSVGVRMILSGTNTNTPFNGQVDTFTAMGPGLNSWPDQHLITVLPDGGGGEVEALCFSNVRARPGDRVGLQKFGAHWIVTGTFGRPGRGATQHFPAYGWDAAEFTAVGTTTSNVFATMPGTPTTSFTKEHDYTAIEVDLRAQHFCATAVPTITRLGVRFTNTATGTVADFSVVGFEFNVLDVNNQISGWMTIDSGVLPAGSYTVAVIWRRAGGGTGTLTTDVASWSSLRLKESTVPYSVTA